MDDMTKKFVRESRETLSVPWPANTDRCLRSELRAALDIIEAQDNRITAMCETQSSELAKLRAIKRALEAWRDWAGNDNSQGFEGSARSYGLMALEALAGRGPDGKVMP